jgi:hypothetical protein
MRLIWWGLLAIILLLAFLVRSATFWLPHWQGDQSQYVTLAMKLSAEGLRGYHLRETEVRIVTLKDPPNFQVIYPTLWKGEKGDLIRAYGMHGLSFYDMPLFYKAPLLPAMVRWQIVSW